MLFEDEQDNDYQSLRALLPAAMRFDDCGTLIDGLSRAHPHCYGLILVETDSALRNLRGTLAELHILRPDAAVVAIGNNGSG